MYRDSHGHKYVFDKGHYIHRTVQGKEYTLWVADNYLVYLENGAVIMTPEEFAAHNAGDWSSGSSSSGSWSSGYNDGGGSLSPKYNPGGTIIPASGETGYNYIYRFLIPEDYVSGETRPLKIQVKQAATSNGEYTSGITEQWITVYPPRTETRIHATYPNSLRVNVDEGTICIYSIQDGEITLTIPEDNISSAGTPTVIEF
jgi:hypothetical protein